jgi:hypothetical protein
MGLLDVFNSDEGRLGLGLLAAAGPSQMGFGERLQGVMHGMDAHKANKMRMGLLQSQMDENAAQTQARAAAVQAKQAELERQARIQQNLPSLFGPNGFDAQAALRLGVNVDDLAKYAAVPDLGRRKATRQIEVDDGQGGKRVALVDDYGQEVGGFAGYTAPVQVNQGDRISFVKPSAGLSLGVGMSPSERDASARGWASVNQGAQRLALDQRNAADSKAPAGYRYKADGTMEIIPGGPADAKASAEGQKKVSEAKDVIALLDEVDTLLPKATGSYAGAGVDQAARFFGASTSGAEATAQLKTLQGALISKMPKMSGPQSDKDVQLYREMAGQVADPTIPVSARQKASETIRKLNEKYAGLPEGSTGKPTVVKTGKYGGRKVEQLSDGTVRYAD